MATTDIDPTTGYYPEPYSLSPLPPYLRTGLLIIGILACFSLITTASVLTYIAFQYFRRSGHAEKSSSFNQCVVLISNLLFADFLQSIAFLISFHWYALDGILAPTSYCYVQAGFLNFGDLASGSFVFVIALHTAQTILKQRSMNPRTFSRVVVFVWCIAIIFTSIGPIAVGPAFFTRAGNWCWISQKYDLARLMLHYLWIFFFQFSTIVIYAVLYCYLHWWSRLAHRQSPLTTQNPQLLKAARSMVVYPIVYTIGTLPIAIGRMLMMSGTHPSSRYFIFAGSMLTSCGWADGLLYAIMRNVSRESGGEQTRTSSDIYIDPSVSSVDSRKTASNQSDFAPCTRSTSAGSRRTPLWQIDSQSTLTPSVRHSRVPSDTSADMASTLGFVKASRKGPSVSTSGMSFSEFLRNEENDHMVDSTELHAIPGSLLQHTAII